MPASKLPVSLARQLSKVPRSVDGDIQYAPCSVLLASGEELSRVFVVEESDYLRHWGNDPARQFVPIDDVVRLWSSPVRLAAAFANKLYRFGESGMGYVVFTVTLRDGRVLPFASGNAVDFPNWPPGVNPYDVVAVEPHAGRQLFADAKPGTHPYQYSAEHIWCLYSK